MRYNRTLPTHSDGHTVPTRSRGAPRPAPKSLSWRHLYLGIPFCFLTQQDIPGSRFTFSAPDLRLTISPQSPDSLRGKQYIKIRNLVLRVLFAVVSPRPTSERNQKTHLKNNREFKLIFPPQIQHYGVFL